MQGYLHNVASGEIARSVELPGTVNLISGIRSEHLGCAKNATYVTRMGSDHQAFMIPNDLDKAEEVDIGEQDDQEEPQVWVGGKNRELIAIYNNDNVRLFREIDGKREFVYDVATPPTGPWAYDNHVRFSPDGTKMVISTYRRTLICTTEAKVEPVVSTITKSTDAGDFTQNGAHYVFFDRGGGWPYRTTDWEQEKIKSFKDHPVHCCPIEDAGFSSNGNLILSNDNQQLLLWSSEGKLLAELSSPKEKDGIECVRMQSAIFLPNNQKIYAADGWNFLEWDLNELAARLKRKPINTPRIEGKVVFDSFSGREEKPVTMTVTLANESKDVITASGPIVRYWDGGKKDTPSPIKVPSRDIMMQPRFFHKLEDQEKIVLRSSSTTFLLSMEGGVAPETLDHSANGIYMPQKKLFKVSGYMGKTQLARYDLFPNQESREILELPGHWGVNSLRYLPISKDGNLIAFNYVVRGKSDFLALVDWGKKKVVYDQKLPWKLTSCEFSPDGKKLVVGSNHRAVYVFDIDKMIAEESATSSGE